jgi:hypothetical protein
MGWRVRRSKKIGPVRVTASKSGLSYSVGVPGARYTVRADGKQQITVGIPGSGVSYTETAGQSAKKSSSPLASVNSGVLRSAPASTNYTESSGEVIAAQLDKVRQQRESVQKGLNGLLIGLLFASPILLLLALIPGVNALLGILLCIPFFSASQKMSALEQQEQRLLQLLDDAESSPAYNEVPDVQDEYEPGQPISMERNSAPVASSGAVAAGTTVSEDLTSKIEDANRKLAKATEMFGEDHPKVADCLEEIAALLRKAKIRTLEAANMEAKARVIRSAAS